METKDQRIKPTNYTGNQRLYTKCSVPDSPDEQQTCTHFCKATHHNRCMYLRFHKVLGMCDYLEVSNV